MLNDGGPKIELWGTPDNISSHVLYDVFMFACSYLQDRQLCVNFYADKLNSYTFSSAKEISCGRQSKTFEKSVRRALSISSNPQTF